MAEPLPCQQIYKNFSHGPVHGTPGTYCQLRGEGTTGRFLYNSSVVFSTNTLSNMKYKMYVFSNEGERQAALQDTRNPGLQYATEMKGENGCDVELLYEFKPATGGGLSINPSLSGFVHTLLDTSSAYSNPSGSYAVMQLKKKALRQSQYLAVRESCDSGDVTAVK